jgi:hypothetical protein
MCVGTLRPPERFYAPPVQLVHLTTCGDAFEARLVAARLGAEGVVWALRGGHDGPLALGTVDVLVDADDLATAREILGDDVEELAPAGAAPERETTGRDVLLALAVLLGMALFAVARIGFRV